MDVLCQAKSGMGKTAVFVLATLQQLEPVDGQVSIVVMCHTRELAFQISKEYERFSKYLEQTKVRPFLLVHPWIFRACLSSMYCLLLLFRLPSSLGVCQSIKIRRLWRKTAHTLSLVPLVVSWVWFVPRHSIWRKWNILFLMSVIKCLTNWIWDAMSRISSDRPHTKNRSWCSPPPSQKNVVVYVKNSCKIHWKVWSFHHGTSDVLILFFSFHWWWSQTNTSWSSTTLL